MTKSISCHDAGKDCEWSANAPTEAELMVKIEEHVKAEHKEIEFENYSINCEKFSIAVKNLFFSVGFFANSIISHIPR